MQSRFINGNPVTGPAITREDINNATESYQILKEALDEVHASKNCLGWELK